MRIESSIARGANHTRCSLICCVIVVLLMIYRCFLLMLDRNLEIIDVSCVCGYFVGCNKNLNNTYFRIRFHYKTIFSRVNNDNLLVFILVVK